MKINCNVVQDLMQLYVEGLLSKDSETLVEEHLAECELCRTKLAELQSINAELNGAADEAIVSDANTINGDVGTFRSFKRWLTLRRTITAIVTAAVAVAIVIGGIYYIEAHESYIPYDETGITVTDNNGAFYIDKNYCCHHGYSFVTETVDGENHCVVFTYLTSSIYSDHLEKKPESKELFAIYSEIEGQSVDDNGEMLDDIVTEVYYLPEEYVAKQGLLNDKHSSLIPLDASEKEQQSIIKQMKADSVLLWKRN